MVRFPFLERLSKLRNPNVFIERISQGANFINVLLAPFLYESLLAAFFYLLFWLWIFGANFWYQKRVRKTLMKLTTVYRCTNRQSLRISLSRNYFCNCVNFWHCVNFWRILKLSHNEEVNKTFFFSVNYKKDIVIFFTFI